jgi:hypothetical protein
MRIAGTVDIDLAPPRQRDVTMTPAFLDRKRTVLELLHSAPTR